MTVARFSLCSLLLIAAAGAPAGLAAEKKYHDPVVFQRSELNEKTGQTIVTGNIWIMEADGSGLRQLTEGKKYKEHASFYSDQEHVLYAEFSVEDFQPDTEAKLFKHNIYTGKREVIAEEAGCALHHASLSPIDDLIAFHHECGKKLSQQVGLGPGSYYVTLRATNGVRTRDGIIAMHEKNLGVSPRKVSLTYFQGHGPGSTARLLTDDAVLHRRAAISPDEEWLAWQTNIGGGEDEIYLAKIDGSEARNLTKIKGNDGHPWFSRDGKWIVFESDRSGQWDIWRIHLESGKQEQLTNGGKKYVSTRARM